MLTARRIIIIIIAVIVIGFLAVLISRYMEKDELPTGLVMASGRIEGTEIQVDSRIPGRIEEVLAQEGDEVKKNGVLARIYSDELQAMVAQSEAALKAATRNAEAAQAQIDLARSLTTQATAAMQQARRDHLRAQELLESNAIPTRQAEEARNIYTQAKAEVKAAEAQLEAARQAQEASAAEEARVRAAVREAEAALDGATVVAPVSGTILYRFVEPGQVITAGGTLFTLMDLDRLYMKVFLSAEDMGRIAVGDPARIHMDSFTDDPFPAVVSRISPEAEFTPREVQTRAERVRLVFETRLRVLENRDDRLKPGMAGEAVIRWDRSTPWVNPFDYGTSQ